MTQELDMRILYKRETGRDKPDVDYIGFDIDTDEEFYFINEADYIEHEDEKYYSVEEADFRDVTVTVNPDLKDYVEWLEQQVLNYEDTL